MAGMATKRVPRTKKKAKSRKPRDEAFTYEADQWDPDDETQVRFDNEGEPRHGSSWDAPFQRLYELKSKREASPKHHALESIYFKLGLARATSRFRWVQAGDSPRRQKAVFGEPPFSEHELGRYSREIEACGRAMVLAWINDDVPFFNDLARVARIEFGAHRKKPMTIEEQIIEEAAQQWHDGCRNPTREEVKREVERKGIKIPAKQWPDYFRRCKLEFLKSRKGPGRPRKPEPLVRVVIENPKGEFKTHHVTASEGARLKQRAKWEMEARAEAEAKGEEYLPF